MFLNKQHIIFAALLVCLIFPAFMRAEIINEIKWDSDLPYTDFSRLIKINKGDPFSYKNIKRSVKLIYGTGRVQQVVVDKEPNGEGSRLTFIVKPLYFIDSINISGNSAISDSDIKLAGNIKRFAPFYESNFDNVREEIIYLYKNEGFFKTKVSIESEKNTSTTVNIKIRIWEGPKQYIKAIALSGDIFISQKRELEIDMKIRNLFSPATETNAQEISDTIDNYFRSKGYFDVKIKKNLTPEEGIVNFNINKGVRCELEIKGATSFSTATLSELINSIENYHIRTEAVEKRVRVFYNSFGFPDAEIAVERKTRKNGDEEVSQIIVNINEGERKFLRAVLLTGVISEDPSEINQLIFNFISDKIEDEKFPKVVMNRATAGVYKDTDGDEVMGLKRTKKNKVSIPGSGYSIPDVYLDDLKNHIENAFAIRGYRDAKVKDIRIIMGKDGYYLKTDISEGRKYMLTWAELRSQNSELDSRMYKELEIKTGIPYSESAKEAYSNKIKKFLQDEGFIFARVTDEVTFQEEKVSLVFKMENMFEVEAGEIIVSGNSITDEDAVKKMLRFSTGDKLSRKQMTESRQTLLQTGAFDAVNINFIDSETPNSVKDVVVTLQEASRFKLGLGAGISSDEGGRFFGEFEYKNIFGKAYALRLSYKLGRKIDPFMNSAFRDYFVHELSFLQQIDRNINLAFIFPDIYFMPFPISAQAELFHIHDTKSNGGLPYMIDKNGFSFSIYKNFGKHYNLTLETQLLKQDEEFQSQNDIIGFLPALGNIANPIGPYSLSYTASNSTNRYIFSPELRGFIDYRDDPFFPMKGFKIWLKFKNLTTLHGTETNYSLIENSFSVYVPLYYKKMLSGEYEARDNIIFQAFMRYAFILLHSGTLSNEDSLKLGGSTSIRGFSQDALYPSDNLDQEHYARYLFCLRTELRVKVFSKLYLVSFLDSGNLWEHVSNIGKNDLLRYSSGAGLMFVSPIGSINAEIGVNLFPKKNSEKNFAEEPWAFHFFISSM